MAPDRDDDLEGLEDDYDDGDEAPQTEVTIEITGLSLYTHHGVSAAEREVGQRLPPGPGPRGGGGRPGARPGPAPRGRRVRCDRHRPRRRHGRLRLGLRARGARRPAAQLQDARAPVLGDRRPPPRRLPRDGGLGEGDEARAPDPPAGRVRVGRGVAPGRRVTAAAGTEFDRATALEPLGGGAYAGAIDAGWFAGRGPNGGYLAAIVLRAMVAEVGDPGREARALT